MAAFVRVVTATGARRGEACALRWSDVDFEARTVTIDESIVASHGGAIVKGPKTRASIRRLSVDVGTAEVLAKLREVQRGAAGDVRDRDPRRELRVQLRAWGETTPISPT